MSTKESIFGFNAQCRWVGGLDRITRESIIKLALGSDLRVLDAKSWGCLRLPHRTGVEIGRRFSISEKLSREYQFDAAPDHSARVIHHDFAEIDAIGQILPLRVGAWPEELAIAGTLRAA